MELTNSNILTRNQSGNQPGEAELTFISSYLRWQIESMETKFREDIQMDQLIAAMVRIKSIDSSIRDLASPDGGNYQGLQAHLNQHLNCENRLSALNIEGLARLDKQGIQQINPAKIIAIPLHDPHAGYCQFDLDDYLEHLECTSIPTKIPASCEPENVKNQLAYSTGLLLDYLGHLIDDDVSEIDNPLHEIFKPKRLIFLLRDTLLLYLGARRLQKSGKNIDAKGAMISRALIQHFTPNFPNNPIYAGLYNSIYTALSSYSGIFSATFIDLYAEIVQSSDSRNVNDLLHFIKKYLSRLCDGKSGYLAIDNAAHGTMPLLAMTGSTVVKTFQLYTGVPWLQDFYGEVIYVPDFPNMRMLESLVCQEELFKFSAITGDRIIIEETNDPVVKQHAAYEIGYFFNAVDARFLQ